MSITLHPRVSAERVAALDEIAKRERFPPSRNKLASILLERAIDAEHRPGARRSTPVPPTAPSKGPWSQAQDDTRAAAGARLKAARSARAWSRRQLAGELGVADTTIGRIEAGKLDLVGRPLAWVEEQERA